MYLYPSKQTFSGSLVSEESTSIEESFLLNQCVVDCPTVNFQMVNNPELGRCEFLGYYCKAGNYKEGCKEVLDPELLTLQPRDASGLDFTFGTPVLRDPTLGPDTFMQSVYAKPIALTLSSDFYKSQVSNCFMTLSFPDTWSCDVCLPGYLIVQDYTKPLEQQVKCVSRCEDGFYPYVEASYAAMTDASLDETNLLGVGIHGCFECSSVCNTCLNSYSDGCTSCEPGQFLEITDNELLTGYCAPKQANSTTLTLEVHGDRSSANTENAFVDLISAVNAAYVASSKFSGLKVVINLNPSVNHYVTVKDSFQAELPMRHLIYPDFSLSILPQGCRVNEKCSQSVKIFNKAGARFKIPVPLGPFTLQNVEIDALDSVIDYVSDTSAYEVYKAIIESTERLCQVSDRGYISCRITVDGVEHRLRPYFHKFQGCYVRPSQGGLLSVYHADPTGRRITPVTRFISLLHSSFVNFFFKFNSLILLPTTASDVPIQAHVKLESNRFHRFSTCGAIVSNNNDTLLQSGMPTDIDNTFISSGITRFPYMSYINNYERSIRNFSSRYFMQHGSNSRARSSQAQVLDITFAENTFSQFNFLKDYATEGDHTGTRNDSSGAFSAILSNRNFGMIVDLADGLRDSRLSFWRNEVRDFLFFYKYVFSMQSDEGEEQTVISHCGAFQVVPFHSQTTLWGNLSNRYAQLPHLISAKGYNNSQFIIESNTFVNISLPSSLIYLNETEDRSDSVLVLSGNTFSMIQPYLGTGILDIRKTLDFLPGTNRSLGLGNSDFNGEFLQSTVRSLVQMLKDFGGNVLIQGNTFTEIVGCPFVHTTLISVSILGTQSKYSDNLDLFDLMMFDEVTQESSTFVQLIDSLYDFRDAGYYTSSLYQDILGSDHTYSIRGLSDTYQLHNRSIKFQDNSYSHISLGVTTETAQYKPIQRGSAHKLNHVLNVEFTGEQYLSVGSHTAEHLNHVISQIKGESSYLFGKELQLDSFSFSSFQEQVFFQELLSCCLIDTFISGVISFTGFNNFTNVWLISSDQMHVPLDANLQETAVILYPVYLFGSLQFGGSLQGEASDSIFIQNITGPFNRLNYERDPFKSWDPSTWTGSLVTDREEDLPYGGNSPLINIQDETNRPDNVAIQNVQIRHMYTRVTSRSDTLQQLPMILSTLQGRTEPSEQKSLGRLTISNFHISDSTYEGGNAFFVAYANETIISNFTATNLGSLQLKTEPQYTSNFDISRFINISTVDFPIFECYLRGGGEAFNSSNITAKGFSISGIGKYSGLPVFRIKQINTPTVDMINQMRIEGSKFSYLQSDKAFASIVYDQTLSSKQVHIVFSTSTFSHLQSIEGVVATQGSLASLTFTDCTFTNNIGEQANLMFLTDSKFTTFQMSGCLVQGEDVPSSKVLEAILSEEPLAFDTRSSEFVVQASTNITIKDTVVQHLHYVATGAYIRITDRSSVVLNRVQIRHLSAYSGGAISVSGYSSLNIEDSTFSFNQAVKNGVIQTFDYAQVMISGCIFNDNQAVFQAVLRVSGETLITISSSRFKRNRAFKQNSIGQLSQLAGGSAITKSIFDENLALSEDENSGAKALEIIYCENEVLVSGSTFLNNLAMETTSNLYINKGELVSIVECTFENTGVQTGQGTNIKGSFIHAIAESMIAIKNSNFIRGKAANGGAIYLMGDASAQISASSFSENYAEGKGGAIQAESFAGLTIDQGTLFFSNQATSGEAIYLSGSIRAFEMRDTEFFSTQVANFVYISELQSVQISSIKLSLPQGLEGLRLNAAAISISDVAELVIRNSAFENLFGNADSGGGALSIIESAQSRNGSYLISECRFIGCSAENGGAASFRDATNVTIHNSEFRKNMASDDGGAINFFCTWDTDCALALDNVTLSDNFAGKQGGAIKWNFNEPLMTRVKFLNNSAGIYGQDLASVPKRIIQIKASEISKKKFPTYSGRYLGSDNSTIESVQSGGYLNLYFALIDKYGAVVRSDNSSKLFINAEQAPGSAVASLLETASQVSCSQGIYIIENLVFVGQPNTTQRLIFTTNAIDLAIPDNRDGSLQEVRDTFEVTLNLRGCREGEQMLPNGKCQECPAGTFLLQAPTQTTLCKDCLDSEIAECFGGDGLYPKRGYWRASKMTEDLIQCRNEEACLGRNPPENNLLGACEVGYQGILCVDCAVGYSRIGTSYKCAKCPKVDTNVLRLIGLFALLMIVLTILIRQNLQSAGKQKNYMPVYIRILLNHLQLLTLTASFDLQWPLQLRNFFSSLKPVSEVSTQFLSVDCFLDERNEGRQSSQDSLMRVFFQKLIILGFSPFIVALASIVVWTCIFSFQRFRKQKADDEPLPVSDATLNSSQRTLKDSWKSVFSNPAAVDAKERVQKQQSGRKRGRIIATIIIILFLIHPTITSIMFNAFNCQNIDGSMRLYEDLEVQCYSPQHAIIAYSVGLPALLIWGIGIPTLGIILIYRNRTELQRIDVKEMYGFLYNGYRQPQAYFWEFIIIYRKIVIIFIQVFLAQTGKIVQALATLLFLIVCISITSLKQPFSNLPLNSLESMSLLSSAITVYCGLFYIADARFKNESDFSMSKDSKSFLFSAIIISHIVFALYWVKSFVYEARQNIRGRFPRLYVSLFLCCQQGKLDKELRVEEFRTKLAPFLAQYDYALDYLERKKRMYNEGTVPLEDDQLRALVLKIAQFAKGVEKDQAYQAGKEKCVRINQLVEERTRRRSSKLSRLQNYEASSKSKMEMSLQRENTDQSITKIEQSITQELDILEVLQDAKFKSSEDQVSESDLSKSPTDQRRVSIRPLKGSKRVRGPSSPKAKAKPQSLPQFNIKARTMMETTQISDSLHTSDRFAHRLSESFQLPLEVIEELHPTNESKEEEKAPPLIQLKSTDFNMQTLQRSSLERTRSIGESQEQHNLLFQQVRKSQGRVQKERRRVFQEDLAKGKISANRLRKSLDIDSSPSTTRNLAKDLVLETFSPRHHKDKEHRKSSEVA